MLAKYMLPKQFKAIEGSLLINIMTLICAKIMYQSIISGREDKCPSCCLPSILVIDTSSLLSQK
jgi:hypothetical protein